MEKTKGIKLKKADWILLALLLTAALAFFLLQKLSQKEGAWAVVYVDGEKTAEYPLSEDLEVRLATEKGGYNLLKIENGRASITEADCPDKICVKTHSIRYQGESITCLPNKTVIVIEGGEEGVDIGP